LEFRNIHEILIWPLEIRGELEHGRGELFDDWQAWICAGSSKWRAADLYDREEPTDEASQFAEFVYFHPYVQAFLYGKKEAVRMLARDDIRKTRVVLSLWEQEAGAYVQHTLELQVLRNHLYLFKTRIALLVMEVSCESLERRLLLEFLNRFRRAYTPFWYAKNTPGLTPLHVEWLDKDGQVLARSDYEAEHAYETLVRNSKVPPVASHWAYLLQPLEQFTHTHEKDVLFFRQIEDERIPCMTFITSKQPFAITGGDFARLTFLDGDGNPATKPYATRFLNDFSSRFCYDRFWDPETSGHEWMCTRYLCCGYAFTVVTMEGNDFLLNHFRRHYFQLGLIAHFHRASLLIFSDRLSEVAKAAPAKRIQDLQLEIALFVSEFWFKEVSNQDQARELFDLWSQHLNTPELFRQVMNEKSSMSELAAAQRQENQTRKVIALTKITVIGLPILLALQFLAIDKTHWSGQWYLGVAIIAGLFVVGLWMLFLERNVNG